MELEGKEQRKDTVKELTDHWKKVRVVPGQENQ